MNNKKTETIAKIYKKMRQNQSVHQNVHTQQINDCYMKKRVDP